MRTTVVSYLDEFISRGDETAFAHQRGLRVARWSYEQTAKTAYRFARELEARGIGKGDRVLLWADNSPEWVASFFGCLLRGVIFVPQLFGGEVFFLGSLNSSHVIETAKRERISVIVTVPRILEALRERIERVYEVRGELEPLIKKMEASEGKHFILRWWRFRHLH